jgi:hypothetical protein
MAYTLTQAQAFLDADGQIERQQLAQLLGVVPWRPRARSVASNNCNAIC